MGYRVEAVLQLTFSNVGSYVFGAHIGYQVIDNNAARRVLRRKTGFECFVFII